MISPSILRRAFAAMTTMQLVACSVATGDDTEQADSASDATPAPSSSETSAADTRLIFDVESPADDAEAKDSAPVAPDGGPAPAPAKSVLPVTWKGQETGYWCGPGSTRMALSTRLSGAALPSQSTLASYLGTTTAGTDNVGLVAGALNHYLATTRYHSIDIHDPPTAAQHAKLKEDVVALVAEGWPLVANVISGWRPPGYPSGTIYHYVAIVGFDDGGEKVLIADPAGAGAGGSRWTAVPQTYWIALGDLATWIGGKGYTGR